MLKLYDYYRSSASFRVRIALHLKQLPYEKIPIHLVKNGGEQHARDYLAINPQGLVPVLQDGNRMVSQSLAIIEYLEALHPKPALFPVDPYKKALAQAFALSIIADIHPLNNVRVTQYIMQELGVSEAKKDAWYQHWIAKGLAALEKNVKTSPFTTEYCFGDQPTIADIVLVPQMFNARRFNCDVSAYPTLVRIDANCQKLAAVQAAWPHEETTA